MSNVATPIVPVADVRQQFSDLTAASVVWLQANWLQILVAATAGTIIFLALHSLRRLGKKLCDRDPGVRGWGTVIGRAVVRTNNFFIVMAAAKLVAGYAAPPAEIATTINFLWTFAAVFQAAIWAREIILGAVEHRTAGEGHSGDGLNSALGLIRLMVTFVVFAIALVVVLDNLGVNITGLVAGLGVGGIAIGLAAKGIFDDLFAALAILFDRPFRRGDSIGYDQTSGTVEEIGLKSTRVRSTSGEERIIANKNLLDKEITNNTRRDRRRVKFALGLVYQTAPAVAKALPATLKAIVEENGMEFVRCGFVGFGDSSLDFELEFDSPHTDFQSMYDARHLIGLAILTRFNEQGIEFAYPTQTSFTAAPDGTLVLPYEEHVEARPSPPSSGS
ncbi:MAG: mechanosensitive ion channel domain-containing protein [Pseudomonadota bacterium]